MLYYFQYEKERMKRLKIAEASKGVGRPKVGGKFELVDHEGRRFGDEDMKGGFTLVSFLFLFFFRRGRGFFGEICRMELKVRWSGKEERWRRSSMRCMESSGFFFRLLESNNG